MSDLLIQGLEVSFLGMGMTFAALGLLIVTMVLLERLFRPTPRLEREKLSVQTATAEGDSEEEEIAAAIAAALAYFDSGGSGRETLGANLELERGGWWRRGQSRAVGRRTGRRAGRQRQNG